MIVSIHQPSYWPWLGLLDKIAKSDLFVLLDNVQLNRDSYQRRNIFLVNGHSKYLTIPIDYHLGVKINEAKIKDKQFTNKHYETLSDWYLKAPFYEDVSKFILPLYQRQYDTLIEILCETILVAFDVFGIRAKMVRASELKATGTKSSLVLNICKEVQADVYLSGEGAKDYFEDGDYEAFKKSGIELMFQKFNHPVYPQFNAGEFIAGLGCLDILFNCGIQKSNQMFLENIERSDV